MWTALGAGTLGFDPFTPVFPFDFWELGNMDHRHIMSWGSHNSGVEMAGIRSEEQRRRPSFSTKRGRPVHSKPAIPTMVIPYSARCDDVTAKTD